MYKSVWIVPTAILRATFWVVFVALTFLYSLMLPAIILPRRWVLAIIKTYLTAVFALIRRILGVRWDVAGNPASASGAVLVAAKHQSAFETLVLQYLLDDPVIVLKSELLAVPVVGWVLRRLGHIGVDRDGGLEAARALRSAALRAHAEGRPIVIFPEGSRRRVGEMADYKSGVDLLYMMLKCECVPVAVNSGRVWPPTSLLPCAGHIVIEFLPAIEPNLPRSAFVELLQREIETATARLFEIRG